MNKKNIIILVIATVLVGATFILKKEDNYFANLPEQIQELIVKGEKNREAQIGDAAIITFVGTKDGIPFDGGTSKTPSPLWLGSSTFIPGFEEGLIGYKKGDTVELELTFPESYQVSELAGEDVIFTVKIHDIYYLDI